MQIFHIDAFTNRRFAGNPAAVIPLQSWLSEDAMQQIAAENNLSETAFVSREVEGEADYAIRWFTPVCEVDLCGHATLAAAHALKRHLEFGPGTITFECQSGTIRVAEEAGRLVLDFPSRPGEPAEITDELVRALGIRPAEVYQARDIMAVYESKKDVLALQPDMERLARIAPSARSSPPRPSSATSSVASSLRPRASTRTRSPARPTARWCPTGPSASRSTR